MQVRNPPLLALGLALLAGAAALGAVMVHDGEVGAHSLAESRAGDDVVAKGSLLPFQRAFTRAAQWAPLAPLMGNATYVLAQEDPALLVLVAADAPTPLAGELVVEGTVLYAGPHPEEGARRLVVMRAEDFRAPLVFR